MRKIILAVVGLAFFATPLAAEHLYSGGYAQQDLGVDEPRNPEAAPDTAAPQRFGWFSWTRQEPRDGPRTGLDRPYGGHGVPYRTPPQGWPEQPQ